MAEFEAANIALQETTLTVAKWQIAAVAAIGLGQIAMVWLGIRVIRQAGERRAREHDQRHTEAMDLERDRHTETMAALDAQRLALETLIERTAPGPAS